MTAAIIDAAGVRTVADSADVGARAAADKFFWLDIFDMNAAAHAPYLRQAGLEAVDVAWALRFGQTGRMHIGGQKMRAVTWIGDRAGNLIEIHVIGRPKCIITIWRGEASTLDEIRRQFAERVGGFDQNIYLSAGILLQLLLGTLDNVIESFDARLDDLRQCLDRRPDSVDFAQSARRLQSLQSISAGFSRYSGAVRSATVGVETLPGMDDLSAAELDDYVERVEDVEDQLYERRRWLSDIMHDFATELAEKQGEQINRLTLVSLIFLPVTALTGFFGMNFDWLNREISGEEAFFVLGLLLPVLCVGLTIRWLSRKGLMRIRLWPVGGPRPALRTKQTGLSAPGQVSAPGAAVHAEFGPSQRPRQNSKG